MKPETKPPQPVLCGCGQSQYNVRCGRIQGAGVEPLRLAGHVRVSQPQGGDVPWNRRAGGGRWGAESQASL